MKTIIEGNSASLKMKFYAPYRRAVIPDSVNYTAYDNGTGTVLVSNVIFEPDDFRYTLIIPPEVNNFFDPTKTEEYRKIIVSWTFDDDQSGISSFIYKIKAV